MIVSFETRFGGHLAQLVQSARLTRERSLVRVQYCPQNKPRTFVRGFCCLKGSWKEKALHHTVQGFQNQIRKVLESVGDTNLDVRQHRPRKVCANVFDFEFNFLLVFFHFFGVTRVFNACSAC